MLSTRLELTDEELDQITRMANFIALFYAKSFLRSRLSLIAPTDDLLFLGSMIWYRDEDEVIAKASIESCLRHQWYFTEALVVFAIFNGNLSEFTRSMLARKLWETPKPKEFTLGKPKFPIRSVDEIPLLHSLIGPNSWLLFHVMRLHSSQTDWLQLPPKYWERMTDYREIRDFVRQLEVVNDCAERGVKLISDFKDICQTEEQQAF
jgi:hypothetical protein